MQDPVRVTWRLVVRHSWGGRIDPAWLPAVGAEGWRSIFEREDHAGRMLRMHGPDLEWRAAAEIISLLTSLPIQYRLQLRVAEDEASRCPHAARHLAALAAAGRGAHPPERTHPPGPWTVRALVCGTAVVLRRCASVDEAEGDAAARRVGYGSLACWAEPDRALPPDAVVTTTVAPGWEPRVDGDVRRVAFAVEDAVAAVGAAAASGSTSPEVIDARLLCLLGEAAYRSILEYRTLMAGVWTDMETCPRHDDHERGAETGMAAATYPGEDGPVGPWRHALLVDGRARQVALHDGQAGATAAVAAARLTDDETLHWAEPLLAGPRPML